MRPPRLLLRLVLGATLSALVLGGLAPGAWAGNVADLSWTPSTSSKTSIRVTRQAPGGTLQTLATVAPTATTFSDGGTTSAGPIADGILYTWCAVEVNVVGTQSAESAPVCGTRAALVAPTGVTNFGINIRQVPTAP